MADDIDGVFTKIGFGKWQLIHITAAILGPAALAPALIGSTLTNAPVAFRCYEDTNSSVSYRTNHYDNKCYPNKSNASTVALVVLSSNDSSFENNLEFENLDSNPCVARQYDTSVFTSTISMEWGLICGDAWLSPLYQVVISAGCMIGDVVGGTIGDRLGRRATLRYGSLVVVGAVLGIGLSPFYWVVLVCRLLLGLSLSSIIYPCYNLVMEITPTSQRTIVGMILCAPYSVAVMIFAGFGYFMRDWRTLHFASSIFAFLLLPVSWFLDESPRWLVQKGRLQDAKGVLVKAASLNRATLPSIEELDLLLRKMSNKDGNKSSLDSIRSSSGLGLVFSNTPMAVIALVTPLTWFLMGVVYLGIPLNVGNFGSDPFLYLALTGLMEMLPTIVGVIFSKRFSRVPVMSFTFFVAGGCSLLVLAASEGLLWLRWILVMVAMEMISTNYMMSYVWAPELYPTVIRSRGCCSCALAGHLGYFVTPFITDFLAQRIWWLPNGIFGVCGLMAGSLVHLLPETKGLALCETVQEVEERWKNRKAKGRTNNYKLDHNPDHVNHEHPGKANENTATVVSTSEGGES